MARTPSSVSALISSTRSARVVAEESKVCSCSVSSENATGLDAERLSQTIEEAAIGARRFQAFGGGEMLEELLSAIAGRRTVSSLFYGSLGGR